MIAQDLAIAKFPLKTVTSNPARSSKRAEWLTRAMFSSALI
jgi:hypothetical protein